MAKARAEQEMLKALVRNCLRGIGVTLLLFSLPILAQQPPVPPQFDLGRQYPYMMTMPMHLTQTVVTVHTVKCVRYVDREGDKLDTNYSILKTNFSVSVTNVSPLVP